MGNVIMKAQQITYGASNVEKALDDLNVPELIELNKRMDAIDAWKANVHEETFTGSELTIENALALPARSLITSINAIQDLHGYDHPWAGGAGKNKLPMILSDIKAANTDGTWSGNVYTINDVVVTVLTDSADNVTGFNLNGVCTANFNFYVTALEIGLESNGMTYSGLTTGSDATYFLYWDGAGVQVDTGEVTITSGRNPIRMGRIVVRANANLSNLKVYPMVRPSTESDASFAPYSNICPISGRDSVVLTRSDGDEISEDFTIQLGTTVYGADINWDTGVLTVLDIIADMGDLTWTYNSTSQVFNSSVLPEATTENVYTDAICSIYKEHQTGMSAMVNGDFRVLDGVMTVKDTAYTDATAFKTAVTGQTVCYELATPTTIQLTPTQLEMLKGYNRVSIEDGSIELKALVLGGDY